MGYLIRMPKLGLEMEVGVVLEWKVDVGDAFEEGDVLAEVESEKSLGEIEAREAGTLRHVYVEEGGEVPPGTPIGIAAVPDADISELETEAEAELAEEAPDVVASGEADGEAAAAETTAPDRSETVVDGSASEVSASEGTAGVKASPRAKHRAEELEVDLTAVEGTGFDGAVTEEDVEATAESAAETAAPSEAESTVPPSAPGVRRIAPTSLAADRYERTAVVAAPSVGEALFGTVEAVRTAFEEHVTMTDVLLVVASAALADRPVVNGTYAESTHQVHGTQNVALVADVDGDPVASVVPDVENRSLSEIIEARRNTDGDDIPTERATFTLANAAETNADGRLVNPPAVAALEVDPTGQRAVPDGDGVDLQPLVTGILTYDTRAVGEVEATAFLERLFERAGGASELILESYRGTE